MSWTDPFITFCQASKNYREVGDMVTEAADAVKNLKSLIGEPKAEARGSRLKSVGVTMMAVPEPTLVPDVAGFILVATGLVKNRTATLKVVDIGREVQGMIKKLGNIAQELTC